MLAWDCEEFHIIDNNKTGSSHTTPHSSDTAVVSHTSDTVTLLFIILLFGVMPLSALDWLVRAFSQSQGCLLHSIGWQKSFKRFLDQSYKGKKAVLPTQYWTLLVTCYYLQNTWETEEASCTTSFTLIWGKTYITLSLLLLFQQFLSTLEVKSYWEWQSWEELLLFKRLQSWICPG